MGVQLIWHDKRHMPSWRVGRGTASPHRSMTTPPHEICRSRLWRTEHHQARACDPRIPRKSREVGKAGRVQTKPASSNKHCPLFLRLLTMAAIAQTLPGQLTTQSPLRVKASRAALVPSPRRRSCSVRAAATGPGPKPKGDLIQNVRQGCDDFLQVNPWVNLQADSTSLLCEA